MEWSWGMSEYTECSKAHTDSTRFNKKIRENLCKFVAEKKHQLNPFKSII